MMKNDITYEYRVFTNRLIDIEAMEVGKCTSKVIKELKPKEKVDGRFFHTSDTDEWFFCWGGELQKLNLKGDSDVNDALAEVEKLIADAKIAVNDAKKTADEAKEAASEAKTAADAASAAVESIENKADKSDVESLVNVVETKADKSVVESLSAKVDAIEVPTKVSQLENDVNYLTEHQDISGKQDIITDLDIIRSGATLGATALQEVPAEYITEDELDDKGYLTEHQDISGKQDVITDLNDIRANATKGATALQSLDNYFTKEEINALIGEAVTITNTILGE